MMYKKVPALLIAALLLLTGCGRALDRVTNLTPTDTVQELFTAANDAMAAQRYARAAKLYQDIKDGYPFSPYTIEAELSLGDAYFLYRQYTRAAEAYKDFEMLHPRHEAMPYVLYQLGLSLRLGYVSVDRSSTPIEEALEYFNRLVRTFPYTEYAEKAREEIQACRRLLAMRDVYIADVYWSTGNYLSAWTRYMHVIQEYPDITDAAAYSFAKGEVAYHRYLGRASEGVREDLEGTWKNLLNWL